MVQIVTLTSTLSDTSEHGVTTVSLGNVVNQLLNEHSLSDTSTSEETDLSTTSVWGEQVDDLDTGDQDLSSGGLVSEGRGIGVDGESLGGLDGSTLINWVTSNVHDTTEGSWTDWHRDGGSSVGCTVTTDETFGTYLQLASISVADDEPGMLTIHSNCSDDILSQMLLLRSSVAVGVLLWLAC